MNDKKQPPIEQWDDWLEPTYRTGGTQPPKSHGGLIALLLVLVIFLCGVSTALGLMNIRLFRQLSQQNLEKQAPVVFSQSIQPVPADVGSPLGFVGQTVPDFWQNYHDLPQGVYITEVLPGSQAGIQGLHPGDILTAFNGTAISDTQALQELIDQYPAGSAVTLRFYRSGQESEITITLP
jgi:membrane-associated protease RseP (regulator of RpoE activity)